MVSMGPTGSLAIASRYTDARGKRLMDIKPGSYRNTKMRGRPWSAAV
jgi:hypothetical protein